MDGLGATWLQISLKIYALSMEDKMTAGMFGPVMNYGWNSPFNETQTQESQC